MMEKLDLRNFKINESEQFVFYRLPKLLFIEPFKNVSIEAKILYGLFLDRMSLSQKNNWADEHGNVYIIYTVDEMMSVLNMSKPTISNLQKELDEIGLIERKRQGQGKPTLIYIKNFASLSQNFLKLKNFTSKGKEDEPLEIKKFYPNDINDNNTNNNDTNFLINGYTDRQSNESTDLQKKVQKIHKDLNDKGLDIGLYNCLDYDVRRYYYNCKFNDIQIREIDDFYLQKKSEGKIDEKELKRILWYILDKMPSKPKKGVTAYLTVAFNSSIGKNVKIKINDSLSPRIFNFLDTL